MFSSPSVSTVTAVKLPQVHRTSVRNCYRNKHSVSLCSILIVSTSDKDTSGVSSIFRAGSSKPASKGEICVVPFTKDAFYSRLSLIPRKYGNMRPVIDLGPLNCFIETPHFQMEHVTTVKSVLKQGHFMTKLHLKDAYLSVAIHPQSKKFLGFLWQSKAYQFRSLPFGLNIAPSMSPA